MPIPRFTLLAGVVGLLGCSTSAALGPAVPSLATLKQAPTSLLVGQATLTLAADLWRDFMPVSPPDGQPLQGVFVIGSADPAVSPGVSFDAVWVINGNAIWAPTLENDPLRDPYPGTILTVGRNGPKWAPGTVVQVVARVRRTDRTLLLIRAPAQTIQHTD